MARGHSVERALHFGTAETHVHQAARREFAALGCVSALSRMPPFADLALDVLLAEGLLGMQGVVGPTLCRVRRYAAFGVFSAFGVRCAGFECGIIRAAGGS
jgi:hypothetical protein